MIVIAASVTVACATSADSQRDPSGSYHFEAWYGARASKGTLHVDVRGERSECHVTFEHSPRLRTLRCVVLDGTLHFSGEGPGRIVRIIATFSPGEMRGSWSSGGQAGSFRARRGPW